MRPVPEKSNSVVGLIGRRGSGKSTMAAHLLQRCERLFVFDPMMDHTWIPNRLHSLDEAAEFLDWSRAESMFAASLIPEGDLEIEADALAETIYDRGDVVFAVEEVPMVSTPGFVPSGLDRVIRLGRHRAVSLLFTAQRAAEVPRRLTAATDVFILFKQTEPRDLDALAERVGRETAVRVADLPLHGHVVYDVMAGEEVGKGREAEFLRNLLCDAHDNARVSQRVSVR